MAPNTVPRVVVVQHPAQRDQRLTRQVASDGSMTPVINRGDSFYFNPSELPGADELVDGAVYALLLAGEALVRRVFITADRVRLQPDNPDFAAIDLTPGEAEARGLLIAGRIVHREGRVV